MHESANDGKSDESEDVNNNFFFIVPQTPLIFDPRWDAPPTAEVIIMGKVDVSSLVAYSDVNYGLYVSYTHADQTTENLCRPLFHLPNHACSN